MPATSTMLQLHRCVSYLAERCDGARAEDGAGYSKPDSYAGHQMAARPIGIWTEHTARAAWLVTRKYRGQLERGGFDVDAIPEVTEPEAQPKPETNGHAPLGVVEPETVVARYVGGKAVMASERYPGGDAIAAIKALPGRRYDPETRTWSAPLAAAEDILAAERVGHLVVTAALRTELAKAAQARADALNESEAGDAELELEGLGGELMPFQRAGVAYAIKSRRTWLADEMGLGKTVEALATLHALDAFPAIVVCPSSLKPNWRREARKWLPSVGRVQILHGTKPHPIMAGTDVIIINYDILHAWIPQLLKVRARALIADESHYVKSHKARRTHALTYLAHGKSPESRKALGKRVIKLDVEGEPIPTRLLLSGTPIINAPPELLSQLKVIDRLNDLGGWRGFTSRYCIKGRWGGFERGGANLEELNRRMREGGFFCRRTKADVLPELPAKRRARVVLPLSNREAYDSRLRTTARAMGKGTAAEKLQKIGALRGMAADGKLEAAIEWIQNMVDSGEKVIVFAHHRRIVSAVADHFDCPSIMGQTHMDDREFAVQQFQEADSCRVIALNLQAGGVGLTLTASSNVVFIESDWTPAGNDQAEDRAHRIGQEQSVTCWYLEAEDTIDEWLSELIEAKRVVVDAATEGDEEARKAISQQLIERVQAASDEEKR